MKNYTTDDKVTWVSSEDDVNDILADIIGPKFVEYREKWNMVNNFELQTDFPLYLQVELHQICNLRCPMCAISIPEASEKYITEDHMSWELYEKIILEAEKYQCPSLTPQGVNEPFLDPDMEKYIRFAADHGFIDIMLNTNATLLSEERAQKIFKSGLTRIRFSLDSASKEMYEKTRVGGNYDKVMKNIERFLRLKKEGNHKLPVVGVNFLKMKFNDHEIDDFVNKWKDEVDFIVMEEFTPPDLTNDFSEFYTPESNYQNTLNESFRCQQPFQRLYIHNDGQVCPCCVFFNRELAAGNVNETSIYDIWNNESLKKLRQIHLDGKYWLDESCKKCVALSSGDQSVLPSGLRKVKAP